MTLAPARRAAGKHSYIKRDGLWPLTTKIAELKTKRSASITGTNLHVVSWAVTNDGEHVAANYTNSTFSALPQR